MSIPGKLVGTSPLPLIGEHVVLKIIDFCAEVEVHQRFKNPSNDPVEVVYTFHLPPSAAVCNFQALINGKKIVGLLKEKEKAKDIYDDAIAKGNTSFKMEDVDDDSFSISIGNLPPNTECTVIITFVCELNFTIDKKLEFALKLNPQTNTSNSEYLVPTFLEEQAVQCGFRLSAEIETTSAIKQIESSHEIEIIREEKSAKISFSSVNVLYESFQLLISLVDPNKAIFRAQDNVVLLALYPELSLGDDDDPITEMIFLVDRSGSMQGDKIKAAQNTMQIFLRSLPLGTYFNIVGFGSRYIPLFTNGSVEYTAATLEIATKDVADLQADLGGTCLLAPLKYILEQKPKEGIPRQLFVLTDGDVDEQQACIDLVRQHSDSTRVFSFGIHGASPTLVQGLAKAGEGKSEIIGSQSRELESIVMSQLKHALQPALTNIQIDWGKNQVQQTPFAIPPVFSGSRVIVYGYVDSNMVPDSITLKAKFAKGEYSSSLYVDPGQKAPGNLIPKLAARSMIRDMEEGRSAYHKANMSKEHIEQRIISLSIGTGIISKLTAFVAESQGSHEAVGGSMQIMQVSQIAPIQAIKCSRKRRLTARPKKALSFKTEKGEEEETRKRELWRRNNQILLGTRSFDCVEREQEAEAIEEEKRAKQKRRRETEERSEGEKEQQRRTEDTTCPKPTVKDILMLQEAAGNFSAGVLKFPGFLSLEKLRQSLLEGFSLLPPHLVDQVLITCLVCAVLKQQYSQVTSQWELAVKKATTWIRKSVKTQEPNPLASFDWNAFSLSLLSS